MHVEQHTTVGFFTDPTLCIGCKACEVACKEHNQLPDDGYVFSGHSYDNTGQLGASTWRHVKFLEMSARLGSQVAGTMTGNGEDPFGWLFLSDVCKHCENSGCLESCPTGAIVRTEVGSVLVQDDVCNGCGYCVVSCPFGVVERRTGPVAGSGGAHKCTFCYDRQLSGLTPACAKTCPTESISFGPLDELRTRAKERVQTLSERGFEDVRVYDAANTSVGGTHALFLTLGPPEQLGLPPHPDVPTVHLAKAWTAAIFTALGALLLSALAFMLTS
ncbi:MAG: 4Fe-4S dicluster domain-containing protein [Myxococcales bacterium]|nr:4Fe-4S dicluster domain-containing protein [Myxococcales bacterium]